jgi:hypothetical protein
MNLFFYLFLYNSKEAILNEIVLNLLLGSSVFETLLHSQK